MLCSGMTGIYRFKTGLYVLPDMPAKNPENHSYSADRAPSNTYCSLNDTPFVSNGTLGEQMTFDRKFKKARRPEVKHKSVKRPLRKRRT